MKYDFALDLQFMPETENWGYFDLAGKVIPVFSKPFNPESIDHLPKLKNFRRLYFKTSIGYRCVDFICGKNDFVILETVGVDHIQILGSFGNRRYQTLFYNLSKRGELRLKLQ